MEYPGTIFNYTARKVFLVTLVALFFIISPIILLYTAGYRYDWRNGFLKETGAISVDIEPRDAVLYLNGIKIKGKMPIRLNNIAPARYTLRLTASGYNDWDKDIEVQNKQTVYIKEISLIKKNSDAVPVVAGNILALALSRDGRFLAYASSGQNAIGIHLWDTLNQTNNNLLNARELRAPLISWGKKNDCAAISDQSAPYNFIKVFCADSPGAIYGAADISSPAQKFQWDETGKIFYYSNAKGLFALYTDTGRTQQIDPRQFPDWFMENGRLWTATAESGQIKFYKDTLGFKSQFTAFDPAGADWKIVFAASDNLLIKKTNASEMAILTADKNYYISGDNFYLSSYNDWWLMWTPWELWTYSRGEEPYLMSRSGENLAQVLPLDKYNTLALVNKNKVTALFPYYYVIDSLLNKEVKLGAADSERKIFYFVPATGNGIWEMPY